MTKFGFTLFTPNMAPVVTWVRFAI